MTKIKICGISQIEHARAVTEAGADFMGLVFAPGKRCVSPQTARQIVQALDSYEKRPLTVGVFVNTPPPEVNRLVAFCGLDWIQLSGDESWEYCRQIEKPIIKVIRVSNSDDTDRIMTALSTGTKLLSAISFTCLLDSAVKGTYGGTGHSFDWQVAAGISQYYPVILAGGLSPDNVAQAIKTAAPWGVDVSSGVETNDSKDISKIQAFVRAVRRADEEAKHTP